MEGERKAYEQRKLEDEKARLEDDKRRAKAAADERKKLDDERKVPFAPPCHTSFILYYILKSVSYHIISTYIIY